MVKLFACLSIKCNLIVDSVNRFKMDKINHPIIQLNETTINESSFKTYLQNILRENNFDVDPNEPGLGDQSLAMVLVEATKCKLQKETILAGAMKF